MKAQAIADYVFVVVGVVAALTAMNVYFLRSLKGSHKEQAERLASASEFFSPKYSNYDRIKESFGQGQGPSTEGFVLKTTIDPGLEQDFYSLTEQETNQVNRVVSGTVNANIQDGSAFFGAAPADFSNNFAGVNVLNSYSIGNAGSVIDDFSEVKLSQDRIFQSESEGE